MAFDSVEPTLEERVALLEKRLGSLRVGDLPLRALQDKLELDWQPNADMLLSPQSITAALLAGKVINSGIGTLTWPGGSATTNTLTVNHDLGVIPDVMVCAYATGYVPSVVAGSPTASSFQVLGRHVDGTLVAAASTSQFFWIAVPANTRYPR